MAVNVLIINVSRITSWHAGEQLYFILIYFVDMHGKM